MGYESRLYIGHSFEPIGDRPPYFDVYAQINLCCMPPEFRNLFKKDMNYLLISDTDEDITEDKYGASLKMATVDEVYEWCMEFAKKETYDRNTILIGLLRGFIDSGHGGFEVIHFGY